PTGAACTYTLSLHDDLPISSPVIAKKCNKANAIAGQKISVFFPAANIQQSIPYVMPSPLTQARLIIKFYTTVCLPVAGRYPIVRSEEHTSELQSRDNLVCRP